jgi:hypothetical protein
MHLARGEARVRREDRAEQLRHLIETVDLLDAAFLHRRLEADWPKELDRIKKWEQREEQGRLAATA